MRDTVVHIYAAEWVWYSRWTGQSPTAFPNPEDFPDLDAIRDPWKSQEQKVRLFVGSLGATGMARVFEYRTFKGDPSKSVFWHMLQHVVNHATFHRGQVTTMLRQLGAPPPKSQDLITYYRERCRQTDTDVTTVLSLKAGHYETTNAVASEIEFVR